MALLAQAGQDIGAGETLCLVSEVRQGLTEKVGRIVSHVQRNHPSFHPGFALKCTACKRGLYYSEAL